MVQLFRLATHPKRIFISYARKDGAAVAMRLYGNLPKNGFEVWLDQGDMTAGFAWPKQIEQALESADVMLAILTPGFYDSPTCNKDLALALGLGKLLIPILAIRGSKTPFQLVDVHRIDFTQGDRLDELVAALEGRPAPAIEPPPRSYASVPPLPANYVERPHELAALREALLAPSGVHGIALTAFRQYAEGLGSETRAGAAHPIRSHALGLWSCSDAQWPRSVGVVG